MPCATASELGVGFAMDSELICVLIKIEVVLPHWFVQTTRGRK
jgi:hypothetical protein